MGLLLQPYANFWQQALGLSTVTPYGGEPGYMTLTPRQQYEVLERYYAGNGLYDGLMQAAYLFGQWMPGMKPLRNPANRVVEFYVSHLWPGNLPEALPIVAENDRLGPAVAQIWQWSNWGSQKQLAARWFALYGDLFIKVVSDNEHGRVWLQLMEPETVTDFRVDARGIVTFIRIDTSARRPDGQRGGRTEVWDSEATQYRLWEHTQSAETPLDSLGTASETRPIADFGIGFIPVVHAKFRDTGETRGANSFFHVLDKIDEANRMATRLHQMLFRHNNVTWALQANGLDATGRPLPAPRVSGERVTQNGDAETVTLGDDKLLRLPGNSSITPLVPAIDYASALNTLKAMLDEIERDLPELSYATLRQSGNPSGVAVELMLGDATAKVLEARGNAEASLARAEAMALTLAQAQGLTGFGVGEIGTYAAGDFEHTFARRPVVKPTDLEVAQVVQAWVTAGVPLLTALRRAGWSQTDLETLAEDQDTQAAQGQTALGSSLTAALKNFNAGQA